MARDYTFSEAFGEVRKAPPFINTTPDLLDSVVACGWHRVNEQYRVVRHTGLPNYLLLFTVEGEGGAKAGSKAAILEKGTLFIIPPGMASEYYCMPGHTWEFYWIHICGQNAQLLLKSILSRGLFMPLDVNACVQRLTALIDADCNASQSGLFAAQTVSALLFDILHAVRRIDSPRVSGGIVQAVIEHIESHYLHPFALSQITAEHFISEEHLIRLFKAKTGTTPYRYYRLLKMTRATQLLTGTEMPVKEIGYAIGYASPAAFCIQFRKEYALSPSEYRRQHSVYSN